MQATPFKRAVKRFWTPALAQIGFEPAAETVFGSPGWPTFSGPSLEALVVLRPVSFAVRGCPEGGEISIRCVVSGRLTDYAHCFPELAIAMLAEHQGEVVERWPGHRPLDLLNDPLYQVQLDESSSLFFANKDDSSAGLPCCRRPLHKKHSRFGNPMMLRPCTGS